MGRKVAIIGAGLSGLTSAKALLEINYEPILFETTNSMGGMWNSRPIISSPVTTTPDYSVSIANYMCWNSLKTNLSKFSCCFSDFSWAEYDEMQSSSSMFPSSYEMSQYLQAYAIKFNIIKYIRFSTTVISISQTLDEKFRVISIQPSGERLMEVFTHVIVSSGFFSEPITPIVSGLKEYFKGNCCHSRDFRSASVYKNRRVAIIGASHSSSEIASEVAREAKEVINIIPRNVYSIPRYCPKDPSSSSSTMYPIDLLFYQINDSQLTKLQQLRKNGSENELNQVEVLFKTETEIAASHRYLSSLLGIDLGFHDPDTLSSPSYVAVSDSYWNMVQSGSIKVIKGRLTSIDNNKNLLIRYSKDNSIFYHELGDVDDIIFCTGYKPRLNFLDEKILTILSYYPNDNLQPLVLYKDIMHLSIPNLYFVGMYRGQYMSVVELQAVLVSNYISGNMLMPSIDELQRGLEKSEQIRNHKPRNQFSHPDYVGQVLDLALLCKRCPSQDFLSNRRLIHPALFASSFNESGSISSLISLYELDDFIGKFDSGYHMAAVIYSQMEGRWNINVSEPESITNSSPNTQVIFKKHVVDHIDLRHKVDHWICMEEKKSYDENDDIQSASSLTTSFPLFCVLYTYNAEEDAIDLYSILQTKEFCTLQDDSNRNDGNKLWKGRLRFERNESGWEANTTFTTLEIEDYQNIQIKYCVTFKGAYISSIMITIESNQKPKIAYQFHRPISL